MQDLEKRVRLLERKLERAERNQVELEEQRRKGQVLYRKLHDDLQRMQAQLIQAEKLASLGQLTAGIAHEIKNPLNFVNNFAEVNGEMAVELIEELDAVRDALPAELYDSLRTIAGDLMKNSEAITRYGKRADSIVKGMMDHAGSGRAVPQKTDLNALVAECVEIARGAAGDRPVVIDLELAGDLPMISVIPPEIHRVLTGLVGNALDAVASVDQGLIWISTASAAGGAEILVRDNGSGIPEEIRERVFEPFFTTKPTGSGTGLGLSLAYDIVVKAHGGGLTFETAEGAGTTFRVFLPT